MLTIVGGTYLETCEIPDWFQMYGSGLRAAIALSKFLPAIEFVSCIGQDGFADAVAICSTFGINAQYSISEKTISFGYYHPLSKPLINRHESENKLTIDSIQSENVLFYGFAEANCEVFADYLVYDPQNWVPFSETKSQAKHLALVLNLKEAFLLSGLSTGSGISEIGQTLIHREKAEVVVIKNGPWGARIFEKNTERFIPLYQTDYVFPIGSGDIFSSVFAYYWAEKKQSPFEAALLASEYTATYCSTRLLPLPEKPSSFKKSQEITQKRKIYIAGPFFSLSQRWLIDEVRNRIIDMGHEVFSPLHDVGWGTGKEIAEKDIKGIMESDVIFAILSDNDPGTIFEIGYAVALNKRVIILAENYHGLHSTMFQGTNCELTDDFTTAIYKASW